MEQRRTKDGGGDAAFRRGSISCLFFDSRLRPFRVSVALARRRLIVEWFVVVAAFGRKVSISALLGGLWRKSILARS